MKNAKVVVNEDKSRNVTVFHDGSLYVTDDSNPRFTDIVQSLMDDDPMEDIILMFSPEVAIAKQFATLSSDVKIEDGKVFWRGETVSSRLSDHIVSLWESGEQYGSVIKFLERLSQNPHEHSREMLWGWVSDRGLSLTDSGLIVAYKGVDHNGYSYNSGSHDIRNGVPLASGEHILHQPTDVIEKDRSEVAFDPSVACSVGLHVGTWDYASSFARGGKIFKVYVDPADWVSTPSDCNGQKGRVCRYIVGEEVTEADDRLVHDYEYINGPDNPDNYGLYELGDYADGLDEDDYFDEDDEDDFLDDEDDDAVSVLSFDPLSDTGLSKPKIDTTKNHLKQQRGPDGKFLKKA